MNNQEMNHVDINTPLRESIEVFTQNNPNLKDSLKENNQIFGIPIRAGLINVISYELVLSTLKKLDIEPEYPIIEVALGDVEAAYNIIEKLENDIKRENTGNTG